MSIALMAVLASMPQLGALDSVPPCEGSVLSLLTHEALQPLKKGSALYVAPGAETLRALERGVTAAIQEGERGEDSDWFSALAQSALAGYELCRGEGEDTGLLLFRPVKAGLGQAAFVWRSLAARPVIIEVPHPIFDQHTLEEGLAAFDALEARVLIVAGAHRCASPRASGCDGVSSVCGARGAYRDSDMAHATDSVFQLAHEIFADRFADDIVLSLHGMNTQGVVVSDGVGREVHSEAAAALLARFLAEGLGGEAVSLCWAPGSAGEELCGTSNVQGRHLNGARDACSEGATQPSGRFVHLEQSRALRAHPEAVLGALDRLVGPREMRPQQGLAPRPLTAFSASLCDAEPSACTVASTEP